MGKYSQSGKVIKLALMAHFTIPLMKGKPKQLVSTQNPFLDSFQLICGAHDGLVESSIIKQALPPIPR